MGNRVYGNHINKKREWVLSILTVSIIVLIVFLAIFALRAYTDERLRQSVYEATGIPSLDNMKIHVIYEEYSGAMGQDFAIRYMLYIPDTSLGLIEKECIDNGYKLYKSNKTIKVFSITFYNNSDVVYYKSNYKSNVGEYYTSYFNKTRNMFYIEIIQI